VEDALAAAPSWDEIQRQEIAERDRRCAEIARQAYMDRPGREIDPALEREHRELLAEPPAYLRQREDQIWSGR
jgi:hypothetical protein